MQQGPHPPHKGVDVMGSFKKRDLSYRVVFSGSSIIGTMEGSAGWSRTERYLAGKLRQEKIKCFRWWCKACEEFPLIFVEDIAEHVIKIPFPSVIKLGKGMAVLSI
jgi:hypothetical protein